uniref:Capsule synthesis protein, CapA n=1 Tax=Shewanella putrefaciens (strain 200) TaxID=399804 RepID=E6XG24_SHEP2
MNVAFIGDIYLDDGLIKCDKDLLAGVRDEINAADFVVANLEAPVTNSNKKLNKIGPNLKMCELPRHLLDSIDVFSLANNHIMDYEYDGLRETLSYLHNNDKLYFGAGVNINDAYREVVVTKGDVSVALIGMAENEFSLTFGDEPGVAPLDPLFSYKYIKNAVNRYEHVVLFIHGGNEFSSLPSPKYRQLCKMFIDMGASAVISSHTHIVGPIELYNGRPIFYSLGNCIFNNDKPPQGWNIGLIALLSITENKISYSYHFFGQNRRNDGVMILCDDELQKIKEHHKLLCQDISDIHKYTSMWSDYIDKHSEQYFFRAFFPFIFRGAYRIVRVLKMSYFVFNKKSELFKQNYISCESHREILTEAIKRKINDDVS